MEWLDVQDDDNQDMNHNYIGALIMKDGFKVRYEHVETYTEEMRNKFIVLFYKHGYDITIKYSNTFAYCEITAVKRKQKYIEIALGICVMWAMFRTYSYAFF